MLSMYVSIPETFWGQLFAMSYYHVLFRNQTVDLLNSVRKIENKLPGSREYVRQASSTL